MASFQAFLSFLPRAPHALSRTLPFPLLTSATQTHRILQLAKTTRGQQRARRNYKVATLGIILVFHPGIAKQRLYFGKVFLKKNSECISRMQLSTNWNIERKGREVLSRAGAIINFLEYKTKSESEGVRSLPVSFTFYLNHSKKLCRNESPGGRINR